MLSARWECCLRAGRRGRRGVRTRRHVPSRSSGAAWGARGSARRGEQWGCLRHDSTHTKLQSVQFVQSVRSVHPYQAAICPVCPVCPVLPCCPSCSSRTPEITSHAERSSSLCGATSTTTTMAIAHLDRLHIPFSLSRLLAISLTDSLGRSPKRFPKDPQSFPRHDVPHESHNSTLPTHVHYQHLHSRPLALARAPASPSSPLSLCPGPDQSPRHGPERSERVPSDVGGVSPTSPL
jgi:hypothetical protein